jgi:hypothetical protein
MGLGAVFVNQLVKFDEKLKEDLDKMLERARLANEQRYIGTVLTCLWHLNNSKDFAQVRSLHRIYPNNLNWCWTNFFSIGATCTHVYHRLKPQIKGLYTSIAVLSSFLFRVRSLVYSIFSSLLFPY